jgi:hypothetical protein
LIEYGFGSETRIPDAWQERCGLRNGHAAP